MTCISEDPKIWMSHDWTVNGDRRVFTFYTVDDTGNLYTKVFEEMVFVQMIVGKPAGDGITDDTDALQFLESRRSYTQPCVNDGSFGFVDALKNPVTPPQVDPELERLLDEDRRRFQQKTSPPRGGPWIIP